MSPLIILTFIFVVLKLTSYIDWSWWWVLSPFIVQWIIIFILATITTWAEEKNRKY